MKEEFFFTQPQVFSYFFSLFIMLQKDREVHTFSSLFLPIMMSDVVICAYFRKIALILILIFYILLISFSCSITFILTLIMSSSVSSLLSLNFTFQLRHQRHTKTHGHISTSPSLSLLPCHCIFALTHTLTQ